MDIKEGKIVSFFIVEDDAFQAFILEKMITSMGYAVKGKSSSGEEAVHLAIQLKPDIILMDISLEGVMDGIEAAIEIQEQISVKIIYITGNSDNHHRERANETDFSDYLIKPVTKDIIIQSLQKLDL